MTGTIAGSARTQTSSFFQMFDRVEFHGANSAYPVVVEAFYPHAGPDYWQVSHLGLPYSVVCLTPGQVREAVEDIHGLRFI